MLAETVDLSLGGFSSMPMGQIALVRLPELRLQTVDLAPGVSNLILEPEKHPLFGHEFIPKLQVLVLVPIELLFEGDNLQFHRAVSLSPSDGGLLSLDELVPSAPQLVDQLTILGAEVTVLP